MELLSKEINEKLLNNEDFILDCFAKQCQLCLVMLPHLELATKMIHENNPNFGVFKYDIDTDREFTEYLGIRSVPTLKIIKGGKIVESKVGVIFEKEILNIYNRHFGNQ